MEQNAKTMKQVEDQYRVVVHLARSLALVHEQSIEVYAGREQSPTMIDLLGARSASIMERLGNILNGMDAVDPDDEWVNLIFAAAHTAWPQTPEYSTLRADLTAAREEIGRLRADKDGAYEERNRVVAALARIFPAGIKRTAIEGWNPEWHGCVYIDLPTGQASWHYHDSHAHLFASLPQYDGEWDGHSTEEKYGRLAALAGGGTDGG